MKASPAELALDAVMKIKSSIKKKTYRLPTPGVFTELDLIFNKYFKFHNCTSIFNTISRFARFDGVLTSGTTSGSTIQIVVEYKGLKDNGTVCSVTKHRNVLLEKQKFANLLRTGHQFGNCPIFYICEFEEAILVYQLTEQNDYKEVLINTQSDSRGGGNVDKYVYFLPYEKVDLIIAKGKINGTNKYQRASINQLLYFINQ